MRGLFLSFLLAAAPKYSSEVVTFRLLLGDEVKEINCSKLPASIAQMQKTLSDQMQKIQQYQQLHPGNDRVEGENLRLLTMGFRLSFLHQELAVLRFGTYYCKNPRDIPPSGEINVEELLM